MNPLTAPLGFSVVLGFLSGSFRSFKALHPSVLQVSQNIVWTSGGVIAYRQASGAAVDTSQEHARANTFFSFTGMDRIRTFRLNLNHTSRLTLLYDLLAHGTSIIGNKGVCRVRREGALDIIPLLLSLGQQVNIEGIRTELAI